MLLCKDNPPQGWLPLVRTTIGELGSVLDSAGRGTGGGGGTVGKPGVLKTRNAVRNDGK